MKRDLELEIIERLTRIEDKVKEVEKHTSVMNSELGICQSKIFELEKYSLRKNLKKLGIQGASAGTIFTVIYWVLKIMRVIP